MNDKETVLTKEGLTKLEEELDELKSIHRREVNDRIRQAKEFVEGRILKVEAMIRNARIIDESEFSTDEVHLGATVKVKDTKSGSSMEFTIVGSTEADPTNQRLSNESPLGKALIGRKKGETLDVQTPRGVTNYKIEAINSKKKAAAKKAS